MEFREIVRKKQALTKEECEEILKNEPRGGICSPSRQLYFDRVTVIGERINPTGKTKLQAALREGNIDYIAGEALREEEAGADALDVNVGLPDIDEPAVLAQATARIQASTQLPLQLDSASVEALSRAARIYNGKPLLNSVNGKKESLEAVLPVAKKYGCAVLGLTLDEKGVPETAEERFAIAERIVAAAEAAGIRRCDILIDCLMMTVGVQPDQALQALRDLTREGSEYAIIYIEEKLAQQISHEIDKYKDSPTPAIILIPGRDGSLGLGQSALRAAVERAVGTNILGD